MKKIGRICMISAIGVVGLYAGSFGPAMWWGEQVFKPDLLFRVYKPLIRFAYSDVVPCSTLVYRYGIWLNPESKPMDIGFEEALPRLIERT